MKIKVLIAAVMYFALSVTTFAAEEFDVSRLSWLEGLWTGSKDGVEMEERWSSVKGGALLGMHRDVSAGRMVSFEFLRIARTAEGIFYFASPQSAPPTPFRLISLNGEHAIFENRQHDFPQRIEYWLDANGALHARIEGPMGGKVVSEEWIWVRSEP